MEPLHIDIYKYLGIYSGTVNKPVKITFAPELSDQTVCWLHEASPELFIENTLMAPIKLNSCAC